MRKIIKQVYVIACLLCFNIACSTTHNNTVPMEKYSWKNVQVVGGGFVDGYLFHPAEQGLMYARTDMGGAYRRDSISKVWIPLNDWVSYKDVNLMGIESMAIDPSDPDKLYLACGTYTDTKRNMPNGEILISNNRGNTFTRIPIPFQMGGNENGRGHGERLMVDPNNSDILYMGTRHDGVWKSTDGALTWKQLVSFPDVKQVIPDSVKNSPDALGFWKWAYRSPGVSMIRIDANSKSENGSSTIYALAGLMNRDNFFVSKDAGATWLPVPNHPKKYMPTDAELDSEGNMYISYGDAAGPWRMYGGAIMKYNTKTGKWTDISPEKPDQKNNLTLGYAAIEIDPQNENNLVTCTFHRSRGEEVFRSFDGGQTWQGTMADLSDFDYSKAPYIALTGIHWLFDFEIDPFDSDHVIFTCGYGGHESYNFGNAQKGNKVIWEVCSEGIEETVPLELLSPPTGPPLITAIGDYGGFVHWDLDKPAPDGNFKNPHFGNTDGIACAESNPNLIVRVGVASHQRPWEEHIGYSNDMGKSWQPTKSSPFEGAKHGQVAVSADGNTWIWTPENSIPYYTKDMGKSWNIVEGVPENIKIIADKINSDRFYGVNVLEGVYYESTDGGINFTTHATSIKATRYEKNGMRGDNRGGQDRIYSTPVTENELWIPAFDGLYLKSSKDTSFSLVPNVTEIHAFGFGKAAPNANYPAIYLVGDVYGQRGIFRSTDKAETWVRINDDDHQWGLVLHITGDPKKYGRVYVGTHGRGTLYGDPE